MGGQYLWDVFCQQDGNHDGHLDRSEVHRLVSNHTLLESYGLQHQTDAAVSTKVVDEILDRLDHE